MHKLRQLTESDLRIIADSLMLKRSGRVLLRRECANGMAGIQFQIGGAGEKSAVQKIAKCNTKMCNPRVCGSAADAYGCRRRKKRFLKCKNRLFRPFSLGFSQWIKSSFSLFARKIHVSKEYEKTGFEKALAR